MKEKDIDLKKKYGTEVYNILQTSYASIGGLHGNGLDSIDDMIENISFWKLIRKNNKIVAVTLYRDSNGRKFVAGGTDKSEEGKVAFLSLIKDDITRNRTYGEISSKLLNCVVNSIGIEELKPYIIIPSDFAKETGKKIYPIDDNDPEVLRHPSLKPYFYRRIIGGELHTKISFGEFGHRIIKG